MKKAPEAFRTISEVAEILETPAHVLRFWESKFYQIRPVKRAGGRRYYRPDDVALINGIKTLLQGRDMTIRGVQRLLQENGVKHVAALGMPLPDWHPAPGAGIGHDDPDLALIDDAELVDDGAVPIAADAGGDEVDAADAAPLTTAETVASAPDEPAAMEPPPAAEPPMPPAMADSEEAAGSTLAAAMAPPPADTDTAAAEPEPSMDSDTLDPRPEAAPIRAPLGKLQPAARDAGEPRPDLPETSDRAQIARRLRGMPRGALGARRDRLDLLSRRIDALLERMSEASGAGRW